MWKAKVLDLNASKFAPDALYWFDSSRYCNHGQITLGNGTWARLASSLYKLDFDGSATLVTISDTSSLNLTASMSIVAWVYADDFVNDYMHVCAKIGGSTNGYHIGKQSGVNKLDFTIGDGVDWQSATTDILAAKTWYCIVGTYDETNIKIYRNAMLEDSQAQSAPADSSGSNLIIGRHTSLTQTARFWKGSIALLRIYNKALCLCDIKKIYETEKHLFGV